MMHTFILTLQKVCNKNNAETKLKICMSIMGGYDANRTFFRQITNVIFDNENWVTENELQSVNNQDNVKALNALY